MPENFSKIVYSSDGGQKQHGLVIEADSWYDGDSLPVGLQITSQSDLLSSSDTIYFSVDDIKEVIAVLSEAVGDGPSSTDGGATLLTNDQRLAVYNRQAAEKAAENSGAVMFAYQPHDGEAGVRRVEVSGVKTTNRGDTLIYGYDLERNDYRCYRLDRIDGAVSAVPE